MKLAHFVRTESALDDDDDTYVYLKQLVYMLQEEWDLEWDRDRDSERVRMWNVCSSKIEWKEWNIGMKYDLQQHPRENRKFYYFLGDRWIVFIFYSFTTSTTTTTTIKTTTSYSFELNFNLFSNFLIFILFLKLYVCAPCRSVRWRWFSAGLEAWISQHKYE